MKQRISEIVERFKPEGIFLTADEVGSDVWQPSRDGGSKVELIRERQAVLDRQAGKAEIDDLIARTERAIARQAR